jgi:hypothetical protein
MKPVIKGMWIVQAIEYILGFGLGWSAINAQDPLLPLTFAIAIIMNAAVVSGSLAAFRITNTTVHRLLGIGIAVVGLIAAFSLSLDTTVRVSLVITAVAQGFVSVRFGHGIRTTRT